MITIGELMALLGACVLIQAFFVSAEVALSACDRTALRTRAAAGAANAARAERMLAVPQVTLATTLVGANLATLIAVVVLALELLVRGQSPLWAPLIAVPPLLVIGHLVPKAIVRDKPEISADEREMIANVFELSEYKVSELMVPLSEVTALPEDAPIREAAVEIADKQHSRMPIYRSRVDDVVGIVHVFDILQAATGKNEKSDKKTVAELAHPPSYVPGTMKASDLLVQLPSSSTSRSASTSTAARSASSRSRTCSRSSSATSTTSTTSSHHRFAPSARACGGSRHARTSLASMSSSISGCRRATTTRPSRGS
jgi:CBS domain containing-hemolysin-like protein